MADGAKSSFTTDGGPKQMHVKLHNHVLHNEWVNASFATVPRSLASRHLTLAPK